MEVEVDATPSCKQCPSFGHVENQCPTKGRRMPKAGQNTGVRGDDVQQKQVSGKMEIYGDDAELGAEMHIGVEGVSENVTKAEKEEGSCQVEKKDGQNVHGMPNTDNPSDGQGDLT